jgi:hypothetical protein
MTAEWVTFFKNMTPRKIRFRAEYRHQGEHDDPTAWRLIGTYDSRKQARLALSHHRACEHETRITPTEDTQP